MGKIADFVAYLESHIGDAYVWGAQGRRVDTMPDVSAWVRKREKGNLIQAARCMRYIRASKKRPLYAFDCSGLIVHWLLDVKHLIKGDVNANGLYVQCNKQGKIGEWQLEAGDLVFRLKGGEMKHVGVYVGGGYIIEAKGRDAGVVKLPLNKGTWTHQGKHPALAEEAENKSPERRVFRIESPLQRGEDIRAMQTALDLCGYPCGDADGICGRKTVAAVNEFILAHDAIK